MKTISHGELRNQSAAVLRDIQHDHEPRIITNHGRPAAVLYPATPAELERAASEIPLVQAGARPAEIAGFLAQWQPLPLQPGESTGDLLDWVRG